MEELRYPIGRFQNPGPYDQNKLEQYISRIKLLPTLIKDEIEGANVALFSKKYREGGWTVAQVINHICDSHINSYIRYRWTLTEDKPLIKAYNEADWAELVDTKSTNVSFSIHLLEALHSKWVNFLSQLTVEDYAKEFIHPESGKTINLFELTALYAWHGDHHLGHIRIAKRDKGA